MYIEAQNQKTLEKKHKRDKKEAAANQAKTIEKKTISIIFAGLAAASLLSLLRFFSNVFCFWASMYT